MLRLALFTSLFILEAISFSVPGVPIQNYKTNDKIKVFANEFDSVKTQLKFPYYFLKFCEPSNHDTRPIHENLGTKLLGISTQVTPYDVRMNKTEQCQNLCNIPLEKEDVENFMWMIDNEYYANLVIDNLPAIYKSPGYSHVGYPLGYKHASDINKDKDEYYIYNHLTFKIQYYQEGNSSRILGFIIEPKSLGRLPGVKTSSQDAPDGTEGYCFQNTKVHGRPDPQKLTTGYISFSYDVEFLEVQNNVFMSRFDTYKLLGNENIHLWSICNSLIIILILAAVIFNIKRNVNNDIKQSKELGVFDDIQDERGWKQLSRDVFRPPNKTLLFSALIGTGVQLGSMFSFVLFFCWLGFMDHSHRGGLLTTIILFYALMGAFAGYYSARIYKMFDGLRWIKCTLATATLYPLTTFITFYAINIVLAFEESSNALDLATTFALLVLWLCLSVPLVFLGSFCGFKKQAIQNPSKHHPIPKAIPPQPMHLNPNTLCLLGGLLPFGSIFIEFIFLMMSIWRNAFYYLFDYLSLAALLLVIISAEISIIITYYQLCNGNHRVWWRSFFNTGSIGLYVFLYSIFYFFTELEITRFSSAVLYFGSMLGVSLTISIVCGTVGFLSSYWFTRKIYQAIRLD